ncbi:MAG: T9SS type A sorting domain-containing protein [Bacteroidaceae bacterium]|nr:T9SS type A sorting domain-containing protein [Bacteroidaceae bacterium]
MKKNLLTLLMAGFALLSYADSRVTYNINVVRDVEKTSDTPTLIQVSTNVLVDAFNASSAAAVDRGLKDGSILFLGRYNDKTYDSKSYGNGFWFTQSGIPCASNHKNRRVACKYEEGYFSLIHNNESVTEDNAFSFIELFVQGKDTVQYNFSVSFGKNESIESDQPAYVETLDHRMDEIETWKLTPLVRQNDGEWLAQNYIQVQAGDKVTFSVADKGDNTAYRVRYLNSDNKQLRGYKADPEYVLTESATPEDAGFYYCNYMYKDADGKTTTQAGLRIYVDVQTKPLGTFWDWTGEVPQFGYNFHDEYGNIPAPTKVHNIKKQNGQKANQEVGEWWSVFWGDDLNSDVGGQEKAREAAKNMVEKYDTDFKYIYENIGWPPNLSARNGYHSMVYIFGSGLANDNTSKTEKGGYQSATSADGGYYACVWASYYPFASFRNEHIYSDWEAQREAMIHEGIHTLFADMDACKRSSWFHEGGNVWTQQELHARRDNTYGTPGFLNAGPVLAPFMPIECYSGWLQDGSFGGPAAEGVNMYGASGQICTWRNLIGGTQYADIFPTVLSAVAGPESVGWIWRYCKNYVLATIGDSIGDTAMRALITQYRARLALFDLNGWDKGYRTVADNNFGVTVKAEWKPCWIECDPHVLTPYQSVQRNSTDGWMAPDTLTNPGWSGANYIPIHVKSDATYAEVEFRPEDTSERALLCYRTKSGECYYSQPVSCGKMRIDLTKKPANGVIFCVVVNTDYRYEGDAQRKHHWDYRIRLGENALAIADTHLKWFFYENNIVDKSFDEAEAVGIEDVKQEPTVANSERAQVKILSSVLSSGNTIQLQLDGVEASDVKVHIVGLSGIVVDNAQLQGNFYTLPSNLHHGLYFIRFTYNGKSDTYKVIVK